MPYSRKLPDDDVLRELVLEDELTNQEIADRYEATAEAVRQALARAKPPIKRPNHEAPIRNTLPWRVRADHAKDAIARRLRSYAKVQQGRQIPPSERKLLDSFMEFMDGANPRGIPLSVRYDRRDPEGFWLAPREPGDHDYVHVPAPTVSVDADAVMAGAELLQSSDDVWVYGSPDDDHGEADRPPSRRRR